MVARTLVLIGALACLPSTAHTQVRTTAGAVEGTTVADGKARVFKGIPFAAPPVGDLRWKPPQPVVPWTGVRQATEFGAHCMQGTIFGDIVFDRPASEDCLYLNVWTPATPAATPRPVMVWIHGGGFQAGAASEPRHDGHHLVQKDVVLVTANHRLGVFGFLAHPGMAAEQGNVSGNFGLLDMVAALQWVKDNAAAFGGDPNNVTIFGESAGSFAVSALMASPKARGLFHKAIGESGAFFGPSLAAAARDTSTERGAKFAAGLGADSLDALRKLPAEAVLGAALKFQPWFSPIIDGEVLEEPVPVTFAAGRQAQVPLLAGWNKDESRGGVVLAKERPTAASFTEQVTKRFGPRAADVLKAYPAGSDAEALESAAELAGDTFIGYATWRWIERHAATTKAPVFRYRFDRKIPVAPDTKINGVVATADDIGARHAGEIEYVLGTLDSVARVPWAPEDRVLSDAIMTYWTTFARSGTPGGQGLPAWPPYSAGTGQVQYLDTTIRSGPDAHRARYELLDAILGARP
jgi:para-nitrobenzyl esterase